MLEYICIAHTQSIFYPTFTAFRRTCIKVVYLLAENTLYCGKVAKSIKKNMGQLVATYGLSPYTIITPQNRTKSSTNLSLVAIFSFSQSQFCLTKLKISLIKHNYTIVD